MARATLLAPTAIPAAGTYTSAVVGRRLMGDVTDLLLQATFDYGSGGTTVKAYVQTSVDGGLTWVDIACFAFATTDARVLSSVHAGIALTAATVPTDGTLTDNTIKDGIIGDRLRLKYVVAGTYAASTLAVYAEAHGPGG